MREIAKHANITVGNIYRYFENKEELADEIITPTLTLLNQAIFEEIAYKQKDVDNTSINMFNDKIHQLTDGFLHVFENNKQECLIVLNYPRFYKQVVQWLYQLIQHLIEDWHLTNEKIMFVDELSMMLSEAIMSGLAKGLSETLVSYHDQPENLKQVINTYFQLFSMMLEATVHEEI
jgi:AcrR family transcriptional regulator